MNNRIGIVFVIAIMVLGSGLLSFAFPAYGEHCWYSYSDIVSKSGKYPFLDSGAGAMDYFFSFFSQYRLNCDKGFIPLIADFPGYYTQDAPDSLTYLNRPLYPALASFVFYAWRFFSSAPDFILAFASALTVNYIVGFIAACALFFLSKRFFSLPIAFISAALFIFSPFFHIFINQPIAEILSACIVVSSLVLLSAYVEKPSPRKLAAYSLLFGFLMLGKMVYALAFFILFMALYFRRYKEGLAFFALQSAPIIGWIAIVKYVLGLPYYIHEINYGDATAAWIFNIFRDSWQETAMIVINSTPLFITNTVHGFLLIPLIIAAYGFYYWPFPYKRIVVFGYIGAFFLLSFIMVFWQRGKPYGNQGIYNREKQK